MSRAHLSNVHLIVGNIFIYPIFQSMWALQEDEWLSNIFAYMQIFKYLPYTYLHTTVHMDAEYKQWRQNQNPSMPELW